MILIRNGRLIDPSQGLDGLYDLLIRDGRVEGIGERGSLGGEGWKVIDAEGLWVIPGMVDMHCHLREPGYEYKETIRTGTMAGVAGGYTTLVAMANTDPVNDNASVTRYIFNKAAEEGVARVLPVGAVTKGMKGEGLSDMGELKEAGVIALSDDGRPVVNSEVMRRALEYAKAFDLPIISHCEDPHLSGDGVMHEGYVSTLLGLRGIPSASEVVMIARDIALAELTGGRLHIAHVSTKRGVELIREAKGKGIRVTAEVTPHHLTLTEEAVRGYDTDTKVNPPLRTEEDRLALIEGLKDGTIDAIATDHAPHSLVEKEVEFDLAAFGMVGLETALPLILDVARKEGFSPISIIEKVTVGPAKILNIEAGSLREGARADVTIIDPEKEWIVDPEGFFSKGRNTPFKGWRMKGKVVWTLVGGKIVYGEALSG